MLYSKLKLVFVLSLLAFGGTALACNDIRGIASVIDGDTLEIHGKRIRLFGIDAPESRQLCSQDGAKYKCGQKAALALDEFIDGRSLACEHKDTDRYGRIVAVCHVGETDLNGWLVENGWALAYVQYSKNYVAQEQEAQAEKRGIWAGEFEKPWVFRQQAKSRKRN